jgi:hypothetical protein
MQLERSSGGGFFEKPEEMYIGREKALVSRNRKQEIVFVLFRRRSRPRKRHSAAILRPRSLREFALEELEALLEFIALAIGAESRNLADVELINRFRPRLGKTDGRSVSLSNEGP